MIIIPSYKAGPIQIGGMTSHLRHKILRYYMQLNNKFAYTCDKWFNNKCEYELLCT